MTTQRLHTRLLPALAVAAGLSGAEVHGEDARITCTGTVTSINGAGLPGTPFSSTSPGDRVTITFDAEIARQLPFGEYLYTVNTPSSSITVGQATDGLGFSTLNRLNIRNDFGQLGDLFAINAQLGSDPSTSFLVQLVDVTAAALASQDVRDLYGTSLTLSSFIPFASINGPSGTVQFDVEAVTVDAAPGTTLGAPYCQASPNSTGAAGTTRAYGLQAPGENDLSVTATGLPTQTFGYFLVSATQAFAPGAGGSDGNLCLGGAIGRFVGQGQIMQSDFGGEISLPVDLTQLPSPTGSVAVQAGETWNFQLWHRDGASSNFTQGCSVTFL
jgi:hypothetical protein